MFLNKIVEFIDKKNEAKSEVPLVGFCTRLYCDNLEMSEGYLLLPNTARLMSTKIVVASYSCVELGTAQTSFFFNFHNFLVDFLLYDQTINLSSSFIMNYILCIIPYVVS